MKHAELRRLSSALESFVRPLFFGLGRVERRLALESYVQGLLLDGERKSVQPMASRLAHSPDEAEGIRQRLQQAIVVASWDDAVVRRRLAEAVAQAIPGLEAFVIDDTGFPKKGRLSPGVSRQYSGTLGRIDNCQVAVSTHVAGPKGSACIAMDLFLPESWTEDAKRRARAHIPEEVRHRPKWRIALDQLAQARAWGLPPRVVLTDGGYGEVHDFRVGLREAGHHYVVRVPGNTAVWKPGTGPVPPEARPRLARGRPPRRWIDGTDAPLSAADLVKQLGAEACETVRWAEGTKGEQTGSFHAVRVRTAHRHGAGAPPGPEEWLIYEWMGDDEPRIWLASLGPDVSLKELVRLAKLRWRVERDYQEMKGELGLDHFEGRTWQGFHHHATLCMVAHAFLAVQRALFPPEEGPVDDLDGPGGASADADREDRPVPSLRPTRRTAPAADAGRAIAADVIR